MLHSLANGNILDLDAVTELNIHVALKWSCFTIDKSYMERQLIKRPTS